MKMITIEDLIAVLPAMTEVTLNAWDNLSSNYHTCKYLVKDIPAYFMNSKVRVIDARANFKLSIVIEPAPPVKIHYKELSKTT